MTDIGRRIVVRLRKGETVEGWDFGQSPLGQYVALDREASHIRFLPEGTYESCSYSYEDMANVRSIIDTSYEAARRPIEANGELADALRAALDRTDFNEIRRLAKAFEELRKRFQGSYDDLRLVAPRDDIGSGSASETVLEARVRYLQLLDELGRSGMLPLLVEHSAVIRRSPLPYFERWYFDRNDDGILLETLYWSARSKEPSLGEDGNRSILERMPIRVLVRSIEDQTPNEPIAEPKGMPKRLRVIAAAGKMVVGGGLATANLSAGLIAGIFAAIPTLGLGAIAGAVGVATSAYTGLNAACDGVKDLASALEG
jgi:hypothetical protein